MTAIADTGFVVAFLNAKDVHHGWAVELAGQVSGPLLTCEAVLIEAAYLLNDPALVTEILGSGLLEVKFNLSANRAHPTELAGRLADQQPDLYVVRMSDLFPGHTVLTTDRRDFAVDRRNKRDVIPAIFPSEK